MFAHTIQDHVCHQSAQLSRVTAMCIKMHRPVVVIHVAYSISFSAQRGMSSVTGVPIEPFNIEIEHTINDMQKNRGQRNASHSRKNTYC